MLKLCAANKTLRPKVLTLTGISPMFEHFLKDVNTAVRSFFVMTRNR